ncbi:MAG: hypothetical protein ACI9IP_002585 [Arcticibacterium sp.]|jgi:hypothetical protein
MKSIQIKKAKSDEELKGILALQTANHRSNLSEDQKKSQGYVTLEYDFEFLKLMTLEHHHVIAKQGDKVVGYALLMDRSTNHLMKVGGGIFPIFEELVYKGQKLGKVNYVSVGQVCVDKDFAGQGILTKMYTYYKDSYKQFYDLAMTDIASDNHRSIRGHIKSGFEVIKTFIEPDVGEPWDIVVWDWRE